MTDDATLERHPQNEHFSGVFHRAAATYDAVGVDFFAPIAAQLVARADLHPGESVLDLGAGRGAALFAAAAQVGGSGQVLGVDIAPGMVERTAADAAERGLDQVSVVLGDADQPPTRDGGWDVAIASFVLFFLPDPVATARRIRGVIRPGGRFVLSTFDESDARWRVVESAVKPFWPPTPASEQPAHPATLSHFASTEDVEALLAEAGFTDVDTVVTEHRNHYRDVEQWLAWTWSAGARVIWERVPDDLLDEAIAAGKAAAGTLAEPDGTLSERFLVRLTRAVAP
jgi:ubiquinone/menaquinone biosynthesis C-methylase UbiE